MFQITIVPSIPGSPATALWFKTKESADAAHTNIHNAQKGVLPTQVLTAKDDFGATLTIDKDSIAYVVLIDGDKQAELATYMGQPQTRPTPKIIPGA